MEPVELEKKNNNAFFSSGAYGCVHYPRIKCDGTQKSIRQGKRKDGLLSKLVLYDYKAKNEYLIGKKLKATSMLKDKPIVVVERKCEIKAKAVNKIVKNYSECSRVVARKRVQRKRGGRKYNLFFSKYYQSITAKEYIYNNDIFSIRRLLKYFYFSIYVSNILKNFNIVHNDMHLNNVIYDKRGHLHIIDFGLSLDIDKIYVNYSEKKTINIKYLSEVLDYRGKPRVIWSFEHHILFHFVFEKRSLTRDDLLGIVNKYYGLFEKNQPVLDIDDYDSYKAEVFKHYSTLFVNNIGIEKHIKTIISKSVYSWDMYRVALSCLKAIEYFKFSIGISATSIKEFKTLLQTCIHYDYNLRPSPEKLLKLISSISLV